MAPCPPLGPTPQLCITWQEPTTEKLLSDSTFISDKLCLKSNLKAGTIIYIRNIAFSLYISSNKISSALNGEKK